MYLKNFTIGPAMYTNIVAKMLNFSSYAKRRKERRVDKLEFSNINQYGYLSNFDKFVMFSCINLIFKE